MRRKIKGLVSHPFIQGGLIFTVSNFIIGFLNYLFNSLSAKTLGPAGYGEITALFSYLVVFSVPLGVINADLIRRIGRLKSNRASVVLGWESWIWKKIYYWRALIIPYFLAALLIPRLTNLSFFSGIALLILILLAFISTFYNAAIQGLQFFLLAAGLQIMSVILKLIGPVLVSFHLGRVNLVLTVLIIGTIIMLVVSQIIISNKLSKTLNQPDRPIASNKRIKALLVNRNIIITLVSLLAITLFNNFDMMFAKKFFSAETAGLYGAWNLLAKIVLYVGGPLSSLSFIYFADQSYKKQHQRGLLFLILGIIGVGGLMFVAYWFFGQSIIALLFNKSYLAIALYLPQAAVFGCLYAFISVVNGYFLANNSLFSLILAIIFPAYCLFLLLFGRSFLGLINLNLAFAAIASVAYLIGLFQVPSFHAPK